LPIEQTDARHQNSQTDSNGTKAMTPETGFGLFIFGGIGTLVFFYFLFTYAMDDREKPKKSEDPDNALVKFHKHFKDNS
jgi:hypothetical protein